MTPEALIKRLVQIKSDETRHILIDMPYCRADHPLNVFKTQLYKQDAPFLILDSLADLIFEFAEKLYEKKGWLTILRDGLRPVEAQEAMGNTPLVKANPHWLEEPRLISRPGQGGHPRGAAFDIDFKDSQTGALIEMGTAFDYFHTDKDPANNPAARAYQNLDEEVLENRKMIERLIFSIADQHRVPLIGLGEEWWDYRLDPAVSKEMPALSNHDLPEVWRFALSKI